MAKKSAKPVLRSLEEADNCLREIAECQIAINTIEADMNISINNIKERAVKLSDPMKANIDMLTQQIKDYAEYTRADMTGKTVQLNFGKYGFRQSSSVSFPAKKTDMVLNNLKQFGMNDCINIKETINKEALERYKDEDIAKVGASRKIKDSFYLEADKTKIRG